MSGFSGCCCKEPTVKLVGRNYDSTFDLFSPIAERKCCEQCMNPCPSKSIEGTPVIRPGDGKKFLEFGECSENGSCWTPSYDFGYNPFRNTSSDREHAASSLRPVQLIGRDDCNYPNTDYIMGNALDSTRQIAKIPIPKIATNVRGDTQDLCSCGLARAKVFSNKFGKAPQLQRLMAEEHLNKCYVCADGGKRHQIQNSIDNVSKTMNRMGMIHLEYNSNSPLAKKLLNQEQFANTNYIASNGSHPLPNCEYDESIGETATYLLSSSKASYSGSTVGGYGSTIGGTGSVQYPQY